MRLSIWFHGITNKNAGGIGLESLDDGAVIPIGGSQVVFTTDSHLVRPIFFPGGDIGRISVCGTINDVAMMGGRPIAISCGLVLEEGFEFDDINRIVDSMNDALNEAGVALVTGDTKVMEKGNLDKIIINTTGIGVAEDCCQGLRPSDRGMSLLFQEPWATTVLRCLPAARVLSLGIRSYQM